MAEPASLDTQADRLALARQKQAERENGIRAAAAKKAREEERQALQAELTRLEGQHQGQIEGINQAHADELTRAHTLIGKAAHRDGLFHGVLIGSALVVALALGAFVILKETVILNTATQRVNYPNPPVLVDQYQEPEYDRDRREPGDAQ
jgi:hypothetical protein